MTHVQISDKAKQDAITAYRDSLLSNIAAGQQINILDALNAAILSLEKSINADAPQPFKKGLYRLKDPAQKDRFYAAWITDEIDAAEYRNRGYIVGKFIGAEFEP